MSDPGPTQPRNPAAPAPTGPYTPVPGSVAELFLPPQSPDEIGRLGDYRILKELGAGGMGAVYLAEDTRLQRMVALKVLLPAVAASEHGKTRFLREARSAVRIRHENVVIVYEVGEVRGVPFIAMERLKGSSLEDWLRKNGAPPIPQVVRIAKEALAGLQAAHDQGLVHRDIKPANMWLEAPKGKVRLLDFGLAVQPDGDERVTTAGVIMGTPAYMSPEQAHGTPVDHRSDLFSLGVVLYRLVTGKLPFTGSSQIDVLFNVCGHTPTPALLLSPNVPAGLDRLIQQLLAKDPNARPQSAAEVIRLLSAPTATQSLAALPFPPPMDVPAAPSGPFPLTPTATPSQFGYPPAPVPVPLPQPVPAPTAVDYAAAALPTGTVTNAFDYTQTDDRRERPEDDRSRRRRDEEDDRPRRRDGADKSDPAGTASVVLGVLAMVSLFLCFCGGYFLAAPLSAAGLIAGFFGRGGLRVTGLILNGVVLLPGVSLIVLIGLMGLSFTGGPSPSPTPSPAPTTKSEPATKGMPTPAGDKATGTLEIQFPSTDHQGLELFVDDRVQPIAAYSTTTTLPLPSGPHTVAVKFNGKEVFAESVAVKAQAQGKTVLKVPRIQNPDAPGTLELQYPEMNGAQWDNVELFVDGKVMLTGLESTLRTGSGHRRATRSRCRRASTPSCSRRTGSRFSAKPWT